MPNWDDVRYFLALADAGSLASAGRALGVKHTTVARHLTQLEEDLGVTLITRTPDGVRLTDAGETALAHARGAERELEAFFRSVAGDDDRVEGVVRVTVSEGFSGYLVRRLSVLRESCPDLAIHVLTDNRTYDMSRGEADIAIRLTSTTDGDLRIQKLVEIGWRIYGSRAYFEGREVPTTLEDLRAHPLIGFGPSLGGVEGAIFLRDRELEPHVVMRVNSLPAALNAVLGGMGLAPLPCVTAIDQPQVVACLDAPIATKCAYLVTHPDLARPRRVQVVLSHLRETVERDRAALGGA